MAGTESFGPFDSAGWSTAQWYRVAMAWAASGVIDSPAGSVSAGSLGITFSGLTPTLAAGRAWVRGGGYELSGGSKTMTAIAASTNASLSRRDRIVLRRDVTAQTIGFAAIQGTPSSSPSAPAIQQNENGQWDLPLFSFLVPPNSGTVITGIVDERLFIDPGAGVLMVHTMANRPATDIATTGMRIAALDDPARVYVYDGTRWVQEGVTIAAAVAAAPAGSYVRRQRDSAVVTVSNTGGGFQIPISPAFSADPVTGAALTPGTNVGGLAVVAAVSGQTTASAIGGVAYDHTGAAIASGTQIRVQYDVVGYNT